MTDSIIIKRRLAGSLGGKIRAELAWLNSSAAETCRTRLAGLR